MDENELSRIIIGSAIEVHKELGPGLLENTYKESLFYMIHSKGILIEKEKSLPFNYKGVKLDCGYRVDLLVENKVVVEIKSTEALNQIHFAQTLTYLRLGHFKLGLLINFNTLLLKDGIKRIANGLDLNKTSPL